MASRALTVATVLAVASNSVNAHGGLVRPKPRAVTTMGLSIESTFGHPISMRTSYTNGKGGNCLDFTPDSNLQTLPYGKSKIEMRANDGANHVGPCTAYLVDPADKNKKIVVGKLDNCMRSLHPADGQKGEKPIPAEMTIDIPKNGLPCSPEKCVLEWYWEATHLTPHELFNNCADVKIGDGSAGEAADTPIVAAPSTAPGADATLAPPSQPSQAPQTPPSAPAGGGYGKYVSVNAGPLKDQMDEWCEANCKMGFCPESHCKQA